MDERQFIVAMDHTVVALKERGYDSYAQLARFVTGMSLHISPTIEEHDT